MSDVRNIIRGKAPKPTKLQSLYPSFKLGTWTKYYPSGKNSSAEGKPWSEMTEAERDAVLEADVARAQANGAIAGGK